MDVAEERCSKARVGNNLKTWVWASLGTPSPCFNLFEKIPPRFLICPAVLEEVRACFWLSTCPDRN
jgi:hypothetical protein